MKVLHLVNVYSPDLSRGVKKKKGKVGQPLTTAGVFTPPCLIEFILTSAFV